MRCFTLPELGTDDDYHGTDVVMASPTQDGPIPITDALAACRDLWRQGVLSYGEKTPQGPDQDSPQTVFAVPELTACVLPTASQGSFPRIPLSRIPLSVPAWDWHCLQPSPTAPS